MKKSNEWTPKMVKDLQNTVKNSSSVSKGLKTFAKKINKNPGAVTSKYYSILNNKSTGGIQSSPVIQHEEVPYFGETRSFIRNIEIHEDNTSIEYSPENTKVTVQNGVIKLTQKQ